MAKVKFLPRLLTLCTMLGVLSLSGVANAASAHKASALGPAPDKTYQLILLRHGESIMNTQKRTSGWGDTHLSEKGVSAGLKVGELLKKEGISIDAVYTSSLSRAIKTAWLALEGMDMMWIPVHASWRLNETEQGAFEGKTREEIVVMWNEEQVKKWESSFDMSPPPLVSDDPCSPAKDPRYSAIPRDKIPQAESMKDTLDRIRAYWQDTLIPVIKSGKTIVVVGHSNALRALSKCIDDTLDEKTLKQMPIPNTTPIIYTLDANMKPISRRVLE